MSYHKGARRVNNAGEQNIEVGKKHSSSLGRDGKFSIVVMADFQ